MKGGFSAAMVDRHPVLIQKDKGYSFVVTAVTALIAIQVGVFFWQTSSQSYGYEPDFGVWVWGMVPMVGSAIFALRGLREQKTHRGQIFRILMKRVFLCVPFVWLYINLTGYALWGLRINQFSYEQPPIFEVLPQVFLFSILTLPVGILLLAFNMMVLSAHLYIVCRLFLYGRQTISPRA
ncbi:MAG: hypothetical protein AAFR74_07135 [Pseudomonadota bacterium]